MASRKKVAAPGVEAKTLRAYEAAIRKAAETGEKPSVPSFLREHSAAGAQLAFELIKNEQTRRPALVSLSSAMINAAKPRVFPEGMAELVIDLLRQPRWRRAASLRASLQERARAKRCIC